nr:response regulator [Thermoanaerobaculia bacterium]
MSEAKTILVVEDEEALAQGLAVNLELKGYQVEVARDGREALELAHSRRFDLILLDLRLPEVDGFEVCQRLRQERDFTPILMLTARSQPDDVVYGLKLGADDYVVKPYDLGELLARIEGLLRRQHWLREGPADVESEPAAEPAPG